MSNIKREYDGEDMPEAKRVPESKRVLLNNDIFEEIPAYYCPNPLFEEDEKDHHNYVPSTSIHIDENGKQWDSFAIGNCNCIGRFYCTCARK